MPFNLFFSVKLQQYFLHSDDVCWLLFWKTSITSHMQSNLRSKSKHLNTQFRDLMQQLSPFLLPQLGPNNDSCFDMNANGFQLYCVIISFYFILHCVYFFYVELSYVASLIVKIKGLIMCFLLSKSAKSVET